VYVVGENPLTRLVAGHELAELVLRTAQSPIVIWDTGGRPVAFNQSFCDTFGYSPEEARTLTHSALIHADERELVRASVAERAPGDHSRRTFRRRLIARDGRIVHVEGSSVGLPMGDQTALLVEYRDVTAQTVARLMLEELEARYQRIFERAPIAIFTTTSDNRIDFANPACLELLGRTPEELSQLTRWIWWSPPTGNWRSPDANRAQLDGMWWTSRSRHRSRAATAARSGAK